MLAVLLNLSSIIFIPGVALLNYLGWMKIRGKGSIVLLPKKTKGRNGQLMRLGKLKTSSGKSRVNAEHPENGNFDTLITNGDTTFE